VRYALVSCHCVKIGSRWVCIFACPWVKWLVCVTLLLESDSWGLWAHVCCALTYISTLPDASDNRQLIICSRDPKLLSMICLARKKRKKSRTAKTMMDPEQELLNALIPHMARHQHHKLHHYTKKDNTNPFHHSNMNKCNREIDRYHPRQTMPANPT
jgi:hypothetical protein